MAAPTEAPHDTVCYFCLESDGDLITQTCACVDRRAHASCLEEYINGYTYTPKCSVCQHPIRNVLRTSGLTVGACVHAVGRALDTGLSFCKHAQSYHIAAHYMCAWCAMMYAASWLLPPCRGVFYYLVGLHVLGTTTPASMLLVCLLGDLWAQYARHSTVSTILLRWVIHPGATTLSIDNDPDIAAARGETSSESGTTSTSTSTSTSDADQDTETFPRASEHGTLIRRVYWNYGDDDRDSDDDSDSDSDDDMRQPMYAVFGRGPPRDIYSELRRGIPSVEQLDTPWHECNLHSWLSTVSSERRLRFLWRTVRCVARVLRDTPRSTTTPHHDEYDSLVCPNVPMRATTRPDHVQDLAFARAWLANPRTQAWFMTQHMKLFAPRNLHSSFDEHVYTSLQQTHGLSRDAIQDCEERHQVSLAWLHYSALKAYEAHAGGGLVMTWRHYGRMLTCLFQLLLVYTVVWSTVSVVVHAARLVVSPALDTWQTMRYASMLEAACLSAFVVSRVMRPPRSAAFVASCIFYLVYVFAVYTRMQGAHLLPLHAYVATVGVFVWRLAEQYMCDRGVAPTHALRYNTGYRLMMLALPLSCSLVYMYQYGAGASPVVYGLLIELAWRYARAATPPFRRYQDQDQDQDQQDRRHRLASRATWYVAMCGLRLLQPFFYAHIQPSDASTWQLSDVPAPWFACLVIATPVLVGCLVVACADNLIDTCSKTRMDVGHGSGPEPQARHEILRILCLVCGGLLLVQTVKNVDSVLHGVHVAIVCLACGLHLVWWMWDWSSSLSSWANAAYVARARLRGLTAGTHVLAVACPVLAQLTCAAAGFDVSTTFPLYLWAPLYAIVCALHAAIGRPASSTVDNFKLIQYRIVSLSSQHDVLLYVFWVVFAAAFDRLPTLYGLAVQQLNKHSRWRVTA